MNIIIELTPEEKEILEQYYEEAGFRGEDDDIELFLKDWFSREILSVVKSGIRSEAIRQKVEEIKSEPDPIDAPKAEWVNKDDILTDDEGVEYRVIQSHRRNPDWVLSETPALYQEIQVPDEGEEYPNWVQPTGGHDAYNTGDTVVYESEHGRIWTSKIDANTAIPDGDVPHNRYWEPVE